MPKLDSAPVFTWETIILDAGDGSGDGIVELPELILQQAGWVLGDVLRVSINKKNQFCITKKSVRKKRFLFK